jgi:hypothetical protein
VGFRNGVERADSSALLALNAAIPASDSGQRSEGAW